MIIPPPPPDDLALLRRFEPVVRFTNGEQFFPMDVDRYIEASRLCVQRPNDVAEVVVPQGKLTVPLLVQQRRDVPGSVFYLSFAEPLSPRDILSFYRTSSLRDFHAGRGRLARVGLLARILDLVFSVTLLLRGKVPGGLAVSAAQRYQALQERDKRFQYYGRVVRDNGYIALQYWFFYAFNDWRSSFYGVNDHESDWETATIYVVEDERGDVRPVWLAYSSHEFEGGMTPKSSCAASIRWCMWVLARTRTIIDLASICRWPRCQLLRAWCGPGGVCSAFGA